MAFTYQSDPQTLSDGQQTSGLVDETGKLLVTTFSTTSGNIDDAAWNGTDNNASVISILKACYAKLVEIAENTTPA